MGQGVTGAICLGQNVVGQDPMGQDVTGAISLGQEVSVTGGSGARSRTRESIEPNRHFC